ncbi:MAG: glycosyl hydrolase 53 family protein [Lachnospiraceae bacterium]|nr:glycosyl hydrolase 53 family protein [Ruminococcus sp.]MCM1274764.1 glycosyl hydrolase 53 family protein [Lachnospiraceae bacterium]
MTNSKFKRIIPAVMAALLLSGCSGGDTPPDNSESTPDKTEVVTYKFEGSPAAESELYVKPIEGLTDSFYRGADVSTYLSQKESGVTYKDFEGNTLDDAGFFELLAKSGVNCIRIRVWNDPKDGSGVTYGGGHNDLDTAVKIGKLAAAAGLPVMIDFHYSDFWADPSKQKAPKEWAHLTFENKKQALYDYTVSSLKTLFDEGVDVAMVQVGNEINNGMAGETDRSRVNELLAQGSAAVRAASAEAGKDVKVVLHYTNALENAVIDIANDLVSADIDYDVFALSFYTFWHGTPAQLTERLKELKELTGRDVLVAETSYAYTDEDGDGSGNTVSTTASGITLDYDMSVQGQANEVRDVMQAVKSADGIGVFYWEPAWIPVEVYDPSAANAAEVLARNRSAWETYGSGWACSAAKTYDPNDAGENYGGSACDNQALFDFNGNPLESLNIFKYVFGGTTAELKVVKVGDISAESGIGQALAVPETVSALMNSGEYMDIPVVWNAEQLSAVDTNTAKVYEIDGVASADGVDYNVKCSLEILKINYIKNPGFEDKDMSMWTLDGNGVGRVADNNIRSGEYSLKFWDETPVQFTAEQKITGIPAGIYELGGYLQGGAAGSSPTFELYITVNGERLATPSKVTSWQNWDNPVITGIEIPEGAEVVVGVKVDAAAKAWGAWDDFTLTEAD